VITSGLLLTPSVGLSHDVSGWSADGVFSQGRIVLNLGLKAEYKSYFATLGWNPSLKAGTNDNFNDRQIVSIAAGMKF